MKIIVKLIKSFIPIELYRKWKRSYLIKKTSPIPIIEHPGECFEKVYHIKDETWEEYQMAEVFDIAKQTTVRLHHQAQDILCVPDARICMDSDIVVTTNGVLWDKSYAYNFDRSIIPWDSDYLCHNQNTIQMYRATKQIEHIKGGCVSLLGVFVQVWAHFMMQFVCKMYYAEEAGLLDKDTTLLVPNNMDANMKELVDNVKRDHPTLKCIEAQNEIEYVCEKLYYIQSTSVFHNQCVNFNHGQIIIPQRAANAIRTHIVSEYLDSINDNSKYEKIFLIRRNTSRSLVNNDEVEEFFRKEGFFFMEGADFSLKEKAEIFHNAKIIVGPQGTAFTNTIFCKEAKCLVFVNAAHVMENSLFTLSYPNVKRCIHVTGTDTSTQYQSTVYIPLDKIKNAYKELLKDK